MMPRKPDQGCAETRMKSEEVTHHTPFPSKNYPLSATVLSTIPLCPLCMDKLGEASDYGSDQKRMRNMGVPGVCVGIQRCRTNLWWRVMHYEVTDMMRSRIRSNGTCIDSYYPSVPRLDKWVDQAHSRIFFLCSLLLFEPCFQLRKLVECYQFLLIKYLIISVDL